MIVAHRLHRNYSALAESLVLDPVTNVVLDGSILLCFLNFLAGKLALEGVCVNGSCYAVISHFLGGLDSSVNAFDAVLVDLLNELDWKLR